MPSFMCNACGKVHDNRYDAAMCHPDIVELGDLESIVERILAPTAYIKAAMAKISSDQKQGERK